MRLGIDFGTSFSLPATSYMDDEMVLLPSGTYGIPSVFYYDDVEDVVLIGQEAEDAGQGEQAKNLKREIKMELNSTFKTSRKSFSGKQIVGHILAKVKDIALEVARQKLINEPLEGVVISVPPAFEHNEKLFIKQAASIPVSEGGPGLNVLGFIKEPVAAALAYFKEPLANQTKILVYDLGGGTCDVAVVEAKDILDERFAVLDSRTVRIGGKDWDAKLASYITRELENQGISICGNRSYEEKVLRAAVKAKHDFSEKVGSKYRDRVRARVELDGQLKQIVITRETLEELTGDLLQKTIVMTKDILANPKCQGVDTIICVGGSSNMPQVRDALEKEFLYNGIKEIKLYEPEKAIALGAAIYAANYDADDVVENGGAFLTDIASYTYGTKVYSGKIGRNIIDNLIVKGDKLPATVERVYYTNHDGQNTVDFNIYESNNLNQTCEVNEVPERPIIEADLILNSWSPEGTELFTKLTLSVDGLLEISADDHRGNNSKAKTKLNFSKQI